MPLPTRSISEEIDEPDADSFPLEAQHTIQGEFTGSREEKSKAHRQERKIEFIAMPLARSNRPVQEEAICEMNLDNGRDHIQG